jgi:hypothetical protein
MNRRSRGKGTDASLVFFAAGRGIRGSNDKVGGVGSHDLNNSPNKWTISGPVIRGENGQYDKGSIEFF